MVDHFLSQDVIDTLLDAARKRCPNVLNIYAHGSHFYGTATSASDYDLVVLVPDSKKYGSNDVADNILISVATANMKIDLSVESIDEFVGRVKEHRWYALECLLLPLLESRHIPFPEIDKIQIRATVRLAGDHAYTKAKKKITIENEIYLGKKSLFHSIRIVDFAIQLLSRGKIENWTSCREIHRKIMDAPDEWDTLDEMFRREYKDRCIDFRKLAPSARAMK